MKFTFSPIHEARLALLAAMEVCWVSTALVFLGALTGLRVASAGSLFLAYWIALAAGRVLPRLPLARFWQQVAAVLVACVTLLAILRFDLAGGSEAGLDFAWLSRSLPSLWPFGRGMTPELLTAATVVYFFGRGLGLAQRPLSLWFVGRQFRLGLAAFFLVLSFSAASGRAIDASVQVLVFIAVSLFAAALARWEEDAVDIPLSPRWGVMLLAAAALVILPALALARLLQVDLSAPLVWLLSPVGTLLGGLLYLFLIPVGWLMELLFNLLHPFFPNLGGALDALRTLPTPPNAARGVAESNPAFDMLVPYLQTLFTLGLFLMALYLVGRSLGRRLTRLEEEEFVRESLEEEDGGFTKAARGPKVAPRRGERRTADSIRRIYAALVARAGAAGLPRRTDETPYEFLPRLVTAWPSEAEPVRAITEAYVAVHYAERAADKAETERVRALWKRVAKNVRRK